MSRRDDYEDEIELRGSAPKPATVNPDRYRFIDAKGKFTSEGKAALVNFRNDCLVPDDEICLNREELESAFEAFPEGFSLGEMDDWETFNEFILKRGPAMLLPGADPTLFESFVTSLIPEREGPLGTTLYGARFVDKLGISAFDPFTHRSAKVEYLVDKLLPLKGVHMLVSLPGALKTWFAYHVAVAVSQGRLVLGRFAAKQGRSVIVDFEMGDDETKRRLYMLGADVRIHSTSFPALRLNDKNFWIELQKLRPRFVVIDGLSSGQTEEYSEVDTRFAEPLARAMRFAHEHECTFLVLHHSPKATSLKDVESFFRGSGAIRSKVDSAYYFRSLPTGPKGEKRAQVMPAKTRKGEDAKGFAIQVTNERGVELFEGDAAVKPAAPLTNKERIHIYVTTKPRCSGNEIGRELKLKRETISKELEELEREGRIRVEGKGRSTAYVAVDGPSPESLPTNETGNASGNSDS